jgi:hypothetical protein
LLTHIKRADVLNCQPVSRDFNDVNRDGLGQSVWQCSAGEERNDRDVRVGADA